MNYLPRLLKLIASFLAIIAFTLFAASFILQDKVAAIILSSLNKNLSTRIETGSFRLSLLRNFPKASLELKNVLVHSSHDFDSKSFGINTDTLLAAGNVSVVFKMMNILSGNYDIEKISAKNGILKLYSDVGGFVNYNISLSGEPHEDKDFTINLQQINLHNIRTSYNNLSVKLLIEGLINDGKIKTRISGKNIDFSTSSAELELNTFRLSNLNLNKSLKTHFSLDLKSTDEGVRFKEGLMKIDNYEITVNGFISSDNVLDLAVTGNKIDVSKIIKYLPRNIQDDLKYYNPAGLINAHCKISGMASKTRNPHVEVSYIVSNGKISFEKSKISVNNLSLKGNFTNGSKNNYQTSVFSSDAFKFNFGSSDYQGSISISDLNKPVTFLKLRGRMFPSEVSEFFGIENIKSSGGSCDLDMVIRTSLWPKEKITIDNFIDMKPRGTVSFNDFSIVLQKPDFTVSRVNGDLSVGDVLTAKNLQFYYKNHEMKVDGRFTNLPEWLLGRNTQMKAVADVTFRNMKPEAFFQEAGYSKGMTGRKAFRMPANFDFNINFKTDSLVYKTFSSSRIVASINYMSRKIDFKVQELNSMKGIISGDGFIIFNTDKTVIARSNFKLNGIDVNKAFKTFHNFGQDFIKAENLSGSLSGSLSLLLPMDSLLNPSIKSITAEGKYVLVDGALINFEPVKKLSSFIELSELENINFDKLENDFSIRNNFLFTPQMDVKSSAADLAVNGKHSLNNDYEYHVKVLLSEILSRKRKKSRNRISEFGVVEDDGLGRTSLLLKVTNKGEEVQVGYDLQAAGNQLKDNIKSEKQTIKQILNEEYGWYKKDSIPSRETKEKKPRFKVTWEN